MKIILWIEKDISTKITEHKHNFPATLFPKTSLKAMAWITIRKNTCQNLQKTIVLW